MAGSYSPKNAGAISEEIEQIFNRYSFEIVGLELGIKKASILPLNKQEIPLYIEELKKRGYHYEISDFYFSPRDGIIREGGTPSEEMDYSVYISKDKRLCHRLKQLDYSHQKKGKKDGKDSKDTFFEMGAVLGYPRCCSEFILSCHDNGQYDSLPPAGQYQDETNYAILALKNSNKVLYQLNNFHMGYPKLFNFFVCKYDCKNALDIANKLLGHINQKSPSEYRKLLEYLKTPIIFFSVDRVIHLLNPFKIGDKFSYSGCFCREDIMKYVNKNKVNQFIKGVNAFSEGDSFKMGDERIIIYKCGKVIHTLKKENKYDGIFIEFE